LKAWNDPARTKTPDLSQFLDKPALEILGNYSYGDVKAALKKYRPTTNIGPNLSQVSVNYPSDAESEDVMEVWDMMEEKRSTTTIEYKSRMRMITMTTNQLTYNFQQWKKQGLVGKRQMLFRWLVLS
jgi:hypothetical protein